MSPAQNWRGEFQSQDHPDSEKIKMCLYRASATLTARQNLQLIKGMCLESKYPCDYTCSLDFTSLLVHSSLQLLIFGSGHQVPITAGWVNRGIVEYKVCLTLLHMASTGNRTPDLLILSPMPYPLGHTLSQLLWIKQSSTIRFEVFPTFWELLPRPPLCIHLSG